MRHISVQYVLWGSGLAGLAVMPAISGFDGWLWELGQLTGLTSALACLLLAGCPVRPRESSPPTLLTLDRHEALGWIAFALAATHVLALLLADRTVLEYLKPTTPAYQLAGILAALLLTGLLVSSLSTARRRLWRSHRDFQATHIVLACALLVLVAAHVAATDRYVSGWPRRLLFVAVTVGALALLLQRRRASAAPHGAHRVQPLVFGRHATLVVSVILGGSLLIAALGATAVERSLREPLEVRTQPLAIDFPHDKHRAVNCITCHHNFVDRTGVESCVPCHRSGRGDLKLGAEARFHEFCFNCHRHPAPEFLQHGPVSRCNSCHVAPSTQVPQT